MFIAGILIFFGIHLVPLVSTIKNTLTSPGGTIDQALTLSSSPVANGLLIYKLGLVSGNIHLEQKRIIKIPLKIFYY